VDVDGNFISSQLASGRLDFDPLTQLSLGFFGVSSVGAMSRGFGWAAQRTLYGTSNRVFWSGGFTGSAGEAAMTYASGNSAITLEMTLTGRSLSWLTAKTSYKLTAPLWRTASWGFARGARGTANVFINPMRLRPGNIWISTERAILRTNGVRYNYHFIY